MKRTESSIEWLKNKRSQECPKCKPSTRMAKGADYVYACGCYWFCGNLVACPKHAPKKPAGKA